MRSYLRSMIKLRQAELSKPGSHHKGDFMSILLEDDLFKTNEELIVDECITFMLAATQTTTLVLTNALYYIARHADKRAVLRSEMRKYIDPSI